MNRLRVLVPLVVLLLAAAPVGANVALVNRDLVVLIVASSGGSAQVGAGVVIGRGGGLTILTAGHVVPEGFLAAVRSPDGVPLEVQSIERIPGHDLALLYTAARAAPVRVAVHARPTSGEALFLWGHPRGKPFILARAIVVDVDPKFDREPAGRFTIACPTCDMGDSGAGVFNERGGLLGILTAAIVDPDGHRLGVWFVEPVDAAVRPAGRANQNAAAASATTVDDHASTVIVPNRPDSTPSNALPSGAPPRNASEKMALARPRCASPASC
jgi:S1-C subfamily serine protease